MFNHGNGSGYSLSDIAAVSKGNENNGWGNDGYWWIILLFLICGWGNNGWGNGNNGTTTREEIAYGFDMNGLENGVRGIQQGLADGFYAMNSGMMSGFAGVNNAICDLGYSTQQQFNASNVALMQAQNALATQLSNCCCDTRAAIQQSAFDNLQGQNAITRQIENGFATVNYNMATNTCDIKTAMANNTRDIIDNQNAGTRAILDYLCQEKIADLQSENQALRLAASQQAQNNYLVEQLGAKVPSPCYVVANPYCNCNNNCNY